MRSFEDFFAKYKRNKTTEQVYPEINPVPKLLGPKIGSIQRFFLIRLGIINFLTNVKSVFLWNLIL
jgi:hypothetical protein